MKGRPDLGSVGRDNGRLVLRFERRLNLASADVRTVLLSELQSRSEHLERWEVDDDCPGSRLSLTAWIDAYDVETAAGTGAEFHRCFDWLVRVIEQGATNPDDVDPTILKEYGAAFAAALADTD